MSLIAACLGLAVADDPSQRLAIFLSFAPGAYVATGLLSASYPRFARRAGTSAKYGMVGGTLSCAAFLVPLSLAHYLISPNHWLALHEEVVLGFVAAFILGVGEGAIYGWLS